MSNFTRKWFSGGVSVPPFDKMFEHAIVKKPGRSFINGITAADLGAPDYEKALQQHGEYVSALERCGLEIIVLEADEPYPDSVFVEDTAVLTPECAVIARPGAPQRRGEVDAIEVALRTRYDAIERIEPPAIFDGGDVLQIGDRFLIGLSARTDEEGIKRFARKLVQPTGGLRTTETCSLTSPLGNLRGSSLRRAVPPIYQVAPTPYFRLTTSGAVPAIVGERRRFYSTETISAPFSFRLKKPGVRRFVFLAKKDRRMRHRTGVSC